MFFVEGTQFWAYDRSFTSRSYCCSPGGGYFANDWSTEPFDKWGNFYGFRTEDGEDAISVSKDAEERFFRNSSNHYILEGFTADGNPESNRIHVSYMSYWRSRAASAPSRSSRSSSSKTRHRRGDGVLTMPVRTNYEFGGKHIYDSEAEALQAKEKMAAEFTKQFGARNVFTQEAIRSQPRPGFRVFILIKGF